MQVECTQVNTTLCLSQTKPEKLSEGNLQGFSALSPIFVWLEQDFCNITGLSFC